MRCISPDPRGYILVDLDHHEGHDLVNHDHAEEHTQVDPLGQFQVDLEHVLEDVLSWGLHPSYLPVEHRALEVILVLALKREKIVTFSGFPSSAL